MISSNFTIKKISAILLTLLASSLSIFGVTEGFYGLRFLFLVTDLSLIALIIFSESNKRQYYCLFLAILSLMLHFIDQLVSKDSGDISLIMRYFATPILYTLIFAPLIFAPIIIGATSKYLPKKKN